MSINPSCCFTCFAQHSLIRSFITFSLSPLRAVKTQCLKLKLDMSDACCSMKYIVVRFSPPLFPMFSTLFFLLHHLFCGVPWPLPALMFWSPLVSPEKSALMQCGPGLRCEITMPSARGTEIIDKCILYSHKTVMPQWPATREQSFVFLN